ncbi:hypothetical protein SLEP1_g42181 [Rubroshorea leprosula]|uniref:RRM domain-containing protein n=1 Tax=Rubroshorea leprosula TaxID=152421 RepID=A0AAV5L8Z1_9ROSI|nr:hypothetical protein SLEP1_g42181 [Rubroshorea leprosula]
MMTFHVFYYVNYTVSCFGAEENLVEEEPSVSKFENIITDGPLTNVDVVEENSGGEKYSCGGRVFSEHGDKNEGSEVIKVPSSDDTSGHGGCSEVAATPRHPSEGVLLQVKTVYLQRLPKSWDVEKLKETCKQYGLIKRVELFQNFGKKGNDVGFIAFTTRESALACIEGINGAQFGEVKGACRGFKDREMHRSTIGLKIIGHAQLEVAQKKAKLTGQSVTNKSEMTEEMTMPIPEQDSQFLSNKRNTEQGGSNKSQSVVVEAHDGSLPSKSGKTRRRRRKRMRGGSNKLQLIVAEAHDDCPPIKSGKTDHRGRIRKRGSHLDYNKRPSKKPYGNFQVQNKDSSRNSKRKSHFRREPGYTTNSIPYRMSYAEDYAPLSSGYPVYAGNAISRSKRPHSYMEPHAGYLEPVRIKDQYYKRLNEPSLIHYEQIHASYLEPSFRNGGLSHADYLQPAQAKDSLPHAGLIESSVKQILDVDYTTRTGAYNGVGN